MEKCADRRLPRNRLGFGIQLCGLRHQLDILPEDLADYASRAQTQYEQLDALRNESATQW